MWYVILIFICGIIFMMPSFAVVGGGLLLIWFFFEGKDRIFKGRK